MAATAVAEEVYGHHLPPWVRGARRARVQVHTLLLRFGRVGDLGFVDRRVFFKFFQFPFHARATYSDAFRLLRRVFFKKSSKYSER